MVYSNELSWCDIERVCLPYAPHCKNWYLISLDSMEGNGGGPMRNKRESHMTKYSLFIGH